MAKRKYWLKLREDYFQSPKIKKLRSIAGGDTYALIYLELQCYSIKSEGIIEFEGLEDNLAQELALILDEDSRNVEVLLSFLEKYKLIECIEDNKYALPEAMNSIGSESECAERVRKHRAKKNQQALQCNVEVTNSNMIETSVKQDVTKRNDIYNKNKEIRDNNKNKIESNDININIINDFIINNKLLYVDGKYFYEYYSQNGWKTSKGEPITNWQNLLITWNNASQQRIEEQRRSQAKTNERHGYVAGENNIPISQELTAPTVNRENINDFLKTLERNGKSSTLVSSLVDKIAQEKEM